MWTKQDQAAADALPPRCPECKGSSLAFVTRIPNVRKVLRTDGYNILIEAGDNLGWDEAGEDDKLRCEDLNCGHEFDVPMRYNVDTGE